MAKTIFAGDKFASLLHEEDIFCRTSIQGKDALITAMTERLAEGHDLANRGAIVKAIFDREKKASTVVSEGVAIPHARLDGIAHPYIAVATSAEGIAFSPGEAKVRLIFLVLAPRQLPGLYLQILSSIAAVLKDRSNLDKAVALETSHDLLMFFKRGGFVLPDYVCAADIMSPVKDTLLDSNNLKSAIDFFVSHEALEVPVVDREGDLVGIVTASALLHVCMPDYLLWIQDLSPILNFEPFVDILRHESSTWLSDIMVQDFASVDIKAPAIAVAEAMARRNGNVCYVTDGDKLVGLITLPHFLFKIFRE